MPPELRTRRVRSRRAIDAAQAQKDAMSARQIARTRRASRTPTPRRVAIPNATPGVNVEQYKTASPGVELQDIPHSQPTAVTTATTARQDNGRSSSSSSSSSTRKEEAEEEEGPLDDIFIELKTLLDNRLITVTTVPIAEFELSEAVYQSDIRLARHLPDNSDVDVDQYFDISGMFHVTVKAKNMSNPYEFTLYDSQDIRPLLERVRYVRKEGFRDIRVQATREAASRPKPQLSQTQSTSRNLQTPIVGTRQTENDQDFNDAEQATGSVVQQITIRWQCHDKTCRNYHHICYPLKGVGHLALTSDDVIRWSDAIKNKDVSINTLPADIAASIQLRWVKQQSKKQGQSSSEIIQPQGHIVQNLQHGISPSHTAGSGREGIRSSPLELDGPDLQHLANYLKWLLERKYITRRIYESLDYKLNLKAWNFETLRDITQDQWEDMNIPPGASLIVVRKQKQWITEQKIPARNESLGGQGIGG